MTLRARLLALADIDRGQPMTKSNQIIARAIALAAGRMALEEAGLACRKKAAHDYMQNDGLPRIAMGNRCDDCADDIRALINELGPGAPSS